MWNKNRPSFLMLIRVQKGFKRIVIPLPLYVLDITLEAVVDLLWLPDLLYPLWKAKVSGKAKGWLPKESPVKLVESILGIFGEFKKHGRWRMVEVEKDDHKVFIDFF